MCDRLVILLVLLSLMIGCDQSDSLQQQSMQKPIIVFAAASVGPVVQSICNEYQDASGIEVTVNNAGSSILARQLIAGAEADLVILANKQWMDALGNEQLIKLDSRINLLSNQLVVVVPAQTGKHVDNSLSPANAFEGKRRIALGDPEHVPAGIYAVETLANLKLLDQLKDRFITTTDVRAALRLVEIGEADAGIVYLSDAISSNKVQIVCRFELASHKLIQYPMAITKNGQCDELYRFLQSETARSRFEEAGFVHIAPPK